MFLVDDKFWESPLHRAAKPDDRSTCETPLHCAAKPDNRPVDAIWQIFILVNYWIQ